MDYGYKEVRFDLCGQSTSTYKQERFSIHVSNLSYINRVVSPTKIAVSSIIWRRFSHYVNFSDQNSTPNRHGNRDDGKVDTRKLDATHTNVFSCQNIPPQKTG